MDIPVKLYDFGVKPPDPPIVRFGKKLADAKTARMDEKRAIDEASSTAIAEDMTKSVLHTKELEGKFGELQARLESLAAPKMQQQPLGLGDMIAIGASGLFGGAQGFSQAAHGVYQRHDEMQKQRYSEDLTNFKMQRENTMDSASRVQDQIEMEAQNLRMLRAKQIEMLMSEDDAKRQEARDNLKHIQQLEELNAKAKTDLTLEQEKQKGRVELQTSKDRVQMFKTMYSQASEEGRRQLAREYSEDPGFIKAMGEMNASERLQDARRKDIEAMRPYRQELMKNQSAAWGALVGNREMDTRVKESILNQNLKETEMMDEEMALKHSNLAFKFYELEYKDKQDRKTAEAKVNAVKGVLANIDSELAKARFALEQRKKELFDAGVKAGEEQGYAIEANDPAVEKVQALEKLRQDWVIKGIEAENAARPNTVQPMGIGLSGKIGGMLGLTKRKETLPAVENKKKKTVEQEYKDRFGG